MVIVAPFGIDAVNVILALVAVVDIDPTMGAVGTRYMGRVNTDLDISDVPAEFTANIEILYDISLVNPVIVIGVIKPLISYTTSPDGS